MTAEVRTELLGNGTETVGFGEVNDVRDTAVTRSGKASEQGGLYL